jgi:hypothetical protein
MHCTAGLPVPEEIFATFAADPTGVLDKVAGIANDSESPLHASVNRFLEKIPPAAVAETCAMMMAIPYAAPYRKKGGPARLPIPL